MPQKDMYKYIFFDLDGTISDSSEGITKGIQKALREMGVLVEDRNELRKYIGPPLKYSFTTFEGFNDEQCDEAIKRYREYYSKVGLFENVPYDGIDTLLKQIKESGRKIAVTTSKPEKFTIQILEKFGILKYFDIVAGATLDERRGEKCDIVAYALEQFGNPDKSEAVLVGDTRFDAEGASIVGIDCIGVLYGFGTEEELTKSGAKYIAPTVGDIYRFL